MDTVSAERRSEIMSRVRGAHTAPELAVRRLIHVGFTDETNVDEVFA